MEATAVKFSLPELLNQHWKSCSLTVELLLLEKRSCKKNWHPVITSCLDSGHKHENNTFFFS